jgi:1-phosphofructokinase family hexose kinase
LEAVIYTLTANPALDRELRVPSIVFGDVLRATAVRVDPGGKGFNVSRALRALGTDSVAVGLVGGFAGQQIAAGLRDAGIATDFVHVGGETRTNVTIVDDRRHIKANEAGPTLKPEEQQQLIDKVRALARADDWWVLSGSLPPGASVELYADIIRILNAAGARALLDASGSALARGCSAAPYLVKPNAIEAADLTSLGVNDEDDAVAAAATIHATGIALVVISMGERGAVLSNGAQAWTARPPSVVERNPIGAGDSMMAGLVWGLSRGLPIEEALRWGVASGAAAASLDGTAFGTRSQVEVLERKVELRAAGGEPAG